MQLKQKHIFGKTMYFRYGHYTSHLRYKFSSANMEMRDCTMPMSHLCTWSHIHSNQNLASSLRSYIPLELEFIKCCTTQGHACTQTTYNLL